MEQLPYPSFIWSEQRGAAFLNAMLPRDYVKRIPKFYESGGRERIEEFAQNISKSMESIFSGVSEMSLQWDDEKGLTNISIGHGGADLNRFSFQEHNLGTKTSLMTSAVIINYINELSGI